MTSIQPEFAVHVVKDGRLITMAGAPLYADAKAVHDTIKIRYPDSVLMMRVWDVDGWCEWEPVDDDRRQQLSYERAACVLVSLVTKGLPRLTWTLTTPDRADDEAALMGGIPHDYDDERRRAIMADYAALLDGVLDEVERTGSTRLVLTATYEGVFVHLSTLVNREAPAEVAA